MNKQKALVEKKEYIDCLRKLLEQNGGRVRLPEKELRIRLETNWEMRERLEYTEDE